MKHVYNQAAKSRQWLTFCVRGDDDCMLMVFDMRSFDCRVHTTGSNVFSHSAVNSNQFQFSQCVRERLEAVTCQFQYLCGRPRVSIDRHIEQNMKAQVQASLVHSEVHKQWKLVCVVLYLVWVDEKNAGRYSTKKKGTSNTLCLVGWN
jgi:hypothetical protein